MIAERLERHVMKVCERNLRSARVKCCAACPWEDQIVEVFPFLKYRFDEKRKYLRLKEGDK